MLWLAKATSLVVLTMAVVGVLAPMANELLFPVFDAMSGYPIELFVIVPLVALLLRILYRWATVRKPK